jgi:murein L,D-transpeptidase YafK
MAKKEPAIETEEEATPAVVKKEPRPAGEEHKELRRVVEAWKKAWEQKDLNAYMSFYDSGFQSRGMDFKAWKKHREKLNRKQASINVEISNLRTERTSPVMATVSFTQKYEGDGYEDEGLKSLLLVKRGKDWKIKEEEWKPLDQESRP